jgi:hypothetical protein
MIMQRLHHILIILTCIVTVSFSTNNDVSENVKYEMFKKGLSTLSTAPYYVVIKVKNQNTNEIKEICTEAPFVEGAIFYQDKLDYLEANKVALSHKDRYFEFSNDSALLNINYDLYTIQDLEKYQKSINLDKIVSEIKSNKLTDMTFSISGKKIKQQVMLAHLLFNNGIMTTRGCIAGNMISFEVFNE